MQHQPERSFSLEDLPVYRSLADSTIRPCPVSQSTHQRHRVDCPGRRRSPGARLLDCSDLHSPRLHSPRRRPEAHGISASSFLFEHTPLALQQSPTQSACARSSPVSTPRILIRTMVKALISSQALSPALQVATWERKPEPTTLQSLVTVSGRTRFRSDRASMSCRRDA